MPVSNNFIKTIKNIEGNIDLTGISGLNTSYRYFKEGYCKLESNKPLTIVPATSSKVNREIKINYKEEQNPTNTSNLNLYFGSKNQHPKPIGLGGGYLDGSDGGIALVAECNESCILEITIRQDTEIDYLIGNYTFLEGDEEMPVELIVRPVINTGTLYQMPPLAPTSIGELNLRKIIDSNNGLTTGTKVWAIDQFQDGKTYNFNINPNSVVNSNIPVNILLVGLETILKCIAAFDTSNNAELDQLEISSDFIGWVKSRSYYKAINLLETQTFQLKPTRTRYIMAFDAGNPSIAGYTDTVIASYSKNSTDPYEGGTFTFLGF